MTTAASLDASKYASTRSGRASAIRNEACRTAVRFIAHGYPTAALGVLVVAVNEQARIFGVGATL